MTCGLLQSSGLCTQKAGKLSLLQIPLRERSLKLFHDCHPAPELRVLLLLYTGEVRTWTHLLCFTCQCTKASSLVVWTPVIMETAPGQVLQNHDKTGPQICDVNIGKEKYRENELISVWSNSMLVTCVWAEFETPEPYCYTLLHAMNQHHRVPISTRVPSPELRSSELLQRGHQLWYMCKGLFKVQSISLHMCGKKAWILFLACGLIIHLSWPRLQQCNFVN